VKILATYENKQRGAKLHVTDDLAYHMTRDGHTTRTDMSKWYSTGQGVVRHIENDIKDGYYPGFIKVKGEDNA
jgi:hypothetical protein